MTKAEEIKKMLDDFQLATDKRHAQRMEIGPPGMKESLRTAVAALENESSLTKSISCQGKHALADSWDDLGTTTFPNYAQEALTKIHAILKGESDEA